MTATIAVRRRDGRRGRRWKRTGSAPPPAALPPERAGFRHRRPGGLAGLAPSARSSGSENLLSQMDRARDRGSRRARCARGYQCGRGIRGWGGCQLRTAMRVLHALGHALVISGSLTWRSSGHTDPRLRPAVVCRPGCAGHRHLAARRRPAQGGTAASCWETTPHRHSRSRTSACCCSPARSTPCGRSGSSRVATAVLASGHPSPPGGLEARLFTRLLGRGRRPALRLDGDSHSAAHRVVL